MLFVLESWLSAIRTPVNFPLKSDIANAIVTEAYCQCYSYLRSNWHSLDCGSLKTREEFYLLFFLSNSEVAVGAIAGKINVTPKGVYLSISKL